MLPYQMIADGSFTLTSTSLPVDVECVSQNPPDFIWIRNRTAWGVAAEGTQAVEYMWHRGMSQGTSQGLTQTTATGALSATASTAAGVASDGISVYDTANPPTFSALTATTTNNTTFVVSMASTSGISVGDIVRMYSVTTMQQISTLDFQVTAVTANVSITLGMMASAVSASANSFAAAGTAAQVLKFIPSRMYPRYRYIAGITRASQAVVYFTVANDYTPGEMISLRIPNEYGATAGAWSTINGRTARVLSVTNSSTQSSVTLDLDTSGIAAAFQYPTSATAVAGISPAVAVPASSGVVPLNGSASNPQQPPGTNLLDAFDNRNTRIVHFGASMFANATANDVWDYMFIKGDQYKAQ